MVNVSLAGTGRGPHEHFHVPCFSPCCRKDAAGRVTGGRDLAGTARYPGRFCEKIFNVWLAEYERLTANQEKDP